MDNGFRGEMMLMNDINDGLKEFAPNLSPHIMYQTSSAVIREIKVVGHSATKKVLENYLKPGYEEVSKKLSGLATKKAIDRLKINMFVKS